MTNQGPASFEPNSGRERSRRTNVVFALGSMGLVFGLFACGAEGAKNGEAPSSGSVVGDSPTTPEVDAGSVSLALNVAGTQLSTVNYTIIGGAFVKSGSFDVSNSTRISSVIGGIPFGKNYALTLTSTSEGPPPMNCTGSATFDLASQAIVSVPVSINCRQSVVAVATPAPLPPSAVFALAIALLGLGITAQRRRSATLG